MMNKMKIMAIAMAAVAGFSAASCVNNDTTNPSNGDNTIVVKLPENITRAVETPVAANATITLSNVTVFLLNGNAVISTADFSSEEIDDKAKRIEQVASAVNRVIVVANIPTDVSATVKALKTAAAVKEYAYTIASQNAAAGVAGLTLMGDQPSFTTPTDPDPDDHNYKEAAVNLDALTARFEVGAVKPGTGIEKVELVGIWINGYYTDGSKANVQTNAMSSSYWYTSPSTSTGTDTEFGAVTITNAYAPTQYYNANSSLVTLANDSQAYAYQVFAGTNIPHVILLVKGEYSDDEPKYYTDDNKYFLGYVTFNKYWDSTITPSGGWITSVNPNVIYKIGVGLEGIEIDADMITEKPEQEEFDLGVKVTLTPWTEKSVTPGV